MNNTVKEYVTITIAVCVCVLVALCSAQGSLIIGEYPALFICLSITFTIQWLVFLPSYYWHTERFYDFTGSLTYIIVIATALYHKGNFIGSRSDMRSLLLAVFILVWALRLGTFLFLRILKDKEDRRFSDWKTSFPMFLRTWTLQGLWVFLTSVAAITAISSRKIIEPDFFLYAGSVIWIFGFLFEAIADYQKRKFRVDNPKKFIHTGLWSLSRHPNYFGEIILWFGIAVIAFPVITGWQSVSLVSPVFIFLLLTRVSGVPILEKHADETWGKKKDYLEYKGKTPVLFPKIFN
jgi:steroid 5-alpha reductase family enzyme